MISIDQLKRKIEQFKFGKYIAIDELLRLCNEMAKKSLEDKLTLNKRAELNEKKKRDLFEKFQK